MKGKKFLALVLCAFMVFGMIPTAAFASEPAAAQTQAQKSASSHVEPQLTSDKVVFVSSEGDDSYYGDETDCPVQTLTRAVEVLGKDGGTIVLCGEVNIGDEPLSTYEYTYKTTVDGVEQEVTETLVDGRFAMPAHTGLVLVTTNYDGIDYAADNGAQISFGKWNDHGNEKSHHFILGGPMTFENVHMAAETNPVFYGRGHFITMGDGITSDFNLLVIGYDQGTEFTKGAVRSTDVDTHIILKSGSYHTVAGMTRQTADGAYLGNAYITVGEGVTGMTNLAGLSVGSTGGYYGNAYIEVNGGANGSVSGATYNSTSGSYGNVELTINGGTYTGRVDGMSTKGSLGFYGNVKTVINGGTFASIEGYSFDTTKATYGNSDLTINGGHINGVLNGVTMMTGAGNTQNIYGDASTTINGGSVTGAPGNVCGGSYRNDYTIDNVTLTINEGTYAKAVVGLNMTGDVVVNESVTLNVTGGNFSSYVEALSHGNSTADETTVTGNPDVYVNISGGALTLSTGCLMLGYLPTSNIKTGRVYYNISGGSVAKMYVGTAKNSKGIVNSGGMYFTYSGGSITEISTAWLTGYQKYYFVGEKTFETTKISGGKGGNNGWPTIGDNAFNYIDIAEYPTEVYVDLEAEKGGIGDYVNDGLSADTPVQSIYDAACTLGPNGGTIYMLADTPGVYTPKTAGTLTFSAILPGETEPNGYGFNLDNSNLYLNSNVVFDGVTFRSTKAERLIAFQGHDVTVNDNCVMVLEDADNGTTGSVGIIMGYSQNTDAPYNGGKTASQISVKGDQTVNINGGIWGFFYGGNRRFGQFASVGTYYGDIVINIGEAAVFTANTPADDMYPNSAFNVTGSNIVKGSVVANIAGTVNMPVYGVGKLGVHFSGVNVSSGTQSGYGLIGTDGIAYWQDTKYEADITINATGDFTLEGGAINAICVPGDTPLYGSFTLNATGSFADGIKSDAKGVMGGTAFTGEGVDTVNYDVANGKENKNSDPIRVITVGDSITWGTCATANDVDGYSYHLYNYNYPMQLQSILGEGAVVGNFGYPGAHAFYGLFNDYYGSSAYGLSMQFGEADAVIIALGTNDILKIANNDGTPIEEGIGYYLDSMRRLIENYHAAYPNATIYVTTALPRWTSAEGAAIVENILHGLQAQVAGEYEYAELMDLYTAMKPYADIDMANGTKLYFADKLHPTNAGYALMAEAVADYLKADFHYYAHEHFDATCTEIGCDKYACIWCDAYYNENETEALGHNMVEIERVEATTDAEGYIITKCSVCGHESTEILPIIGRTYTEYEVIAPTCTTPGYTRHYCDQDDSYYDDTFVDALGHDHVTNTVDATCTVDGSVTTTCSRCDYSDVKTIPAFGHTEGDAATCTKNQVCVTCGETLVAALGHDESTVVVAATATTLGYTHTTCSRCDYDVKADFVDATDKLVVFVDTTAEVNGNGTLEAPFDTYTEAFLWGDVSFDRTIVLMSMVQLNATYTERAHTAHYTVTSVYNDVDYAGGFNVTGGYHYVLAGDTTFENLEINLASTLVFRCKFNAIVIGEGVTNTGLMYVVGADQDSKTTVDTSKDVNITVLSGTYAEIVGGFRSGGKGNITGTINIYFGGTAVVDKLFIGNRSLTKYDIQNANLTIDGGIINVFVTASDAQTSTAATGAAKGTVTVNITKNFDITKSFTVDGGVSYTGIVISAAIKTATENIRDTYGTYILNIDALVYDEIVDSGFIIETSIHELNKVGEIEAGDFNRDGELTNSDVTLIVRYLAGWDVDGIIEDVTDDGLINNRDALYVVQKIAGWFDEQ